MRSPTLTASARNWVSFSKKRGYPDSHRQTTCPRNRSRNRTTNVTERRNQQNPIHPHLPSTKPCSQKCHSQNPNYSLFIFYLYSLFLIHYSASTPEHIFPLPPLISFKRDKNVGNYLVRSAFKSEIQEGTFKCTRTRCKTCPFISNILRSQDRIDPLDMHLRKCHLLHSLHTL